MAEPAEPADVQIAQIHRTLADDEARLHRLTEAIVSGDYEPDTRAALEKRHAAMRSNIDAARDRLTELGG